MQVKEQLFSLKTILSIKYIIFLKDDEGRYILIDIEMLNKRLTLANAYAPNSGDHPDFLDKVIYK